VERMHSHHDYVDERPGAFFFANDLADYYPAAGVAGQSRNGAGGAANPGAASGSKLSLSGTGSVSIGGSPALAMIGIVALALLLLHLE
jgi:hypothetical protein